jgi:hypothetical protein
MSLLGALPSLIFALVLRLAFDDGSKMGGTQWLIHCPVAELGQNSHDEVCVPNKASI